MHHALQMTGALCAAAAALPGTIPNLVRAGSCGDGGTIRIQHPKGLVVVTADVDPSPPATVRAVGVVRTARRLMNGTAYVRRSADGRHPPVGAARSRHAPL